MKPAFIKFLALAALCALSIPGHAQKATPKPTPSPATRQKIRPKATMNGVGTAKIIKGAKNAGRKTESGVGTGASKAKKYLSQDARKVQKAVSGQDKKHPPTPKP